VGWVGGYHQEMFVRWVGGWVGVESMAGEWV
jgi:hypothetical protein